MTKAIYTKQTLDYTTGEYTEREVLTKKVVNEAHFTRTYTEDVMHLCKCSGAEVKVVLSILQWIEYNTNRFILTKDRRETICEASDITMNTLNCSVSRLIKKNILIKESSNTYMLNPKMFFYGTDIERNKMFKLSISYIIG